MALWGNTDSAANAPKNRVTDKFEVGSTAGRSDATIVNVYNTTTGLVRVVGADVAEAAVTDHVTHPGWIVIREGSGPVTAVGISAGGSGYAVNDTITLTPTSTTYGERAAVLTVTTVSTGAITGLAITDPGTLKTGGYTVSTSGSGTGSTLTFTLGGRAGRKHYETLVAMGSLTSDGSDDTVLPDA